MNIIKFGTDSPSWFGSFCFRLVVHLIVSIKTCLNLCTFCLFCILNFVFMINKTTLTHTNTHTRRGTHFVYLNLFRIYKLLWWTHWSLREILQKIKRLHSNLPRFDMRTRARTHKHTTHAHTLTRSCSHFNIKIKNSKFSLSFALSFTLSFNLSFYLLYIGIFFSSLIFQKLFFFA